MIHTIPELSSDEQLNSNYQLGIQILTPVHIGAGAEKNWFKGMDYFSKDGYVFVLDSNQLYRKLMQHSYRNGTALDRYTELLSGGYFDRLERFVLDEVGINLDEVCLYQFEYKQTPTEIRSLVRDGNGNCYIPGSSIKGAIRSVLFNYLYTATNAKQINRTLENDLLGNFDKSIMRYIRPYDAQMLDTSQTELQNVLLFNLYNKGTRWISDYKQGFNLALESFMTDAQLSFRLSIADNLLTKIERYSPNSVPLHVRKIIKKGTNPLHTLFGIINSYTRLHLEREIAFFEKHPQAEGSKNLIGLLCDFRDECKENSADSCILRLAWGSGFHGITGDWRFNNHLDTLNNPDRENMVWDTRTRSRQPARYKSRRLANYGDTYDAMGFVRLNFSEK